MSKELLASSLKTGDVLLDLITKEKYAVYKVNSMNLTLEHLDYFIGVTSSNEYNDNVISDFTLSIYPNPDIGLKFKRIKKIDSKIQELISKRSKEIIELLNS